MFGEGNGRDAPPFGFCLRYPRLVRKSPLPPTLSLSCSRAPSSPLASRRWCSVLLRGTWLHGPIYYFIRYCFSHRRFFNRITTELCYFISFFCSLATPLIVLSSLGLQGTSSHLWSISPQCKQLLLLPLLFQHFCIIYVYGWLLTPPGTSGRRFTGYARRGRRRASRRCRT